MTKENVSHVSPAAAVRADSGVCPNYHAAIELIGRRWNGVILRHLAPGAARFSELRTSIPGITDTMLTQRLRELEDAAIVSRDVVATRPIVIRYALTEMGRELSPILDAVAVWSNQWTSAEQGDAPDDLSASTHAAS